MNYYRCTTNDHNQFIAAPKVFLASTILPHELKLQAMFFLVHEKTNRKKNHETESKNVNAKAAAVAD